LMTFIQQSSRNILTGKSECAGNRMYILDNHI
jgi:hypothetical protein